MGESSSRRNKEKKERKNGDGDLETHSKQETQRDVLVRPGVGGEAVVTAGSYHDPTGHQIQIIMKIRWLVLLLFIIGQKKTTPIPGRETCVGSIKGKYCQSPSQVKKLLLWRKRCENL